MESFDQSVTLWIRDLKGGHDDAVGKLWAKYFERLVRTAGRKLADVPKRMADEEDVALSAFHSLCRGAQAGRFDLLQDRDDLWRLLVAIASRKAVDQMRRQTSQKRGGGAVRGESVVYTADGEAAGRLRPVRFQRSRRPSSSRWSTKKNARCWGSCGTTRRGRLPACGWKVTPTKRSPPNWAFPSGRSSANWA